MKDKFTLVAGLIAVIWIVFIIDLILPIALNSYGIVPRTTGGLVGIITSPFLHGGWGHILSNTVPLFFLSLTLVFFYEKSAIPAIALIVLLGGAMVWGFGRFANHIGASGLIFGLMGFLLMIGIFRRDFKSILISVIIFLTYGGSMLFGILPGQRGISWEGHLFGAIAGGITAFLFRKERV